MNKLFTKIATAFVGIAMAIGVGVAIGSGKISETHAADDIVITFPSSPSKYTNSYTSSFTQTHSSIVFTFNGWNNGASASDNWTSIRGGQKKSAWSGTVSSGQISSKIASVDVTLTQLSACNGSKLEISSSSSFDSIEQTISKAAGDMSASKLTYTVTTPTADRYYRLTFDQTANANGSIRMSRIAFNYASTKTLSNISVETVPTKRTYAVGECFDPTGLVIRRTYSDSTYDTYAYAGHESEFSFTPSTTTPLTANDTSVSITYSEKSTSQAIVVKTLSSIAVTTAPTKTTYSEGDSFDPTGMVVTATFSDSSTTDVTSSCTFTPDPLTTDTTDVTISYGGKTTTQAVTVNEKHGTKTNPYSVDEAFAAISSGTGISGVYATGIVSQIVTEYSSQYGNITFDISADGTTSGNQLRAYRCVSGDVTIASNDDVMVGDIVIVGGNLTTYGDIKEFGQGCQLDSRTRKTISSLTVTDNSGKTWFDGDTVQVTDLQVVVNYSNDTHETITDGTGVTITSGATLSEGSNTVNVSFTNAYGTKTGSISISAAAVAVLDSVTITGTAHADKNGPWDLSNLTVTGTSQGGSAGDMGNITEDCELSTSASTTNPGNTTITVRVNYKSDTKIIDVENVDAVIRNIDKYTDTIDLAFTGQSGTSYGSWSGKQDQSDAIYAGNNAGGNSSVQLRSSNNSGVVSTGSGGDLISITINFDSNTVATRTVSIYGNTTPYSSAADLYSSSTSGTLIGEINIDNGASQTITVKSDESYQFVGIRSKSGAIYISSIEIVWGHEEQIKTLDSLSVTTNPTKSTYAAGETLNLTGLVVTAHYKEQGIDDAPTVAFTTSPEAGYVFTAEDGEAGYKVIDITSTENAEITTSFNVTVTPKKPTALNSTSAATWTDTQTLAGGAGRWKAVFTDSSEITNIKIGDANTVLKIGGVAVDTTLLAKTYAGQDATLEYTSQNTTVSNTFTIAVTNELSVDSFEDVPEYVLVTKSSDLIKANFTSLNGTPESYSVVSSNASKLSVSFDSALVDYDSSTKKGYLYFQVTAGNTQGQYTVTVSVTLGSRTESKSVSITVMGEAPTPSGVQYEQIASLDDLTSGKYVIAANVNGTYYALPSISSGKIEASTVTVSNGIITEEDAGVLPVDILKDGSGNIAIGKSGTYFSFPSSGTNFSVSSTATYYEVATNATGGTFKVATRGLVYRTGSTNQWGAYANSNIDGKEYFGFELFKEVSSSAEKTSFDWVKEFVDGYMYMDVISITDKGTGQCKGENGYYLTAKRAWNTMKTAYAEAGGLDDLVEVFENSFEDAHARYMSWASACGDSDPFNGTTIKTSTRIAMLNSVMNSNTTIIVIVTVGIAAIAIGGYFLLRKKKED